jgi:hypothetical protein
MLDSIKRSLLLSSVNFAMFVLSSTAVNATTYTDTQFIECISQERTLTFALTDGGRNVRNLEHDAILFVTSWSEHTIQTEVSIMHTGMYVALLPQFDRRVSLSQQEIRIDFDRLRGTASLTGLLSLTGDELRQCTQQRDNPFPCFNPQQVLSIDFSCQIIVPKF